MALGADPYSAALQRKSYTGRPSVFISNAICDGFGWCSDVILEL